MSKYITIVECSIYTGQELNANEEFEWAGDPMRLVGLAVPADGKASAPDHAVLLRVAESKGWKPREVVAPVEVPAEPVAAPEAEAEADAANAQSSRRKAKE